MHTHIGIILQEELKRDGRPTVQDFAKELGVSPRTLYNVFNGSSDLPFGQIIKASEILRIDLVSKYLKANSKEKILAFNDEEADYKSRKNICTVSLAIAGDFKDMATGLAELMEEVRREASVRGLYLV